MSALAPRLQAFFTDRLVSQRHSSPHTVAAYRDAFRLLLGFAAKRTHQQPSTLDIADLDAPLVGAFLDHLEADRHNAIRTRNNRLAAIHSFFAYAALYHPEHAACIQRVLAIPAKRFESNLVTYLVDDEVDALLAACNRSTWVGRRDHAMFVLAIQTGLRISELAGLSCADTVLDKETHTERRMTVRKIAVPDEKRGGYPQTKPVALRQPSSGHPAVHLKNRGLGSQGSRMQNWVHFRALIDAQRKRTLYS